MCNVDAIIYTKNLINELAEKNVFGEHDVFLEKDVLYDKVLEIVKNNALLSGKPTINNDEINEAIRLTRRSELVSTFDKMISKGVIIGCGIDKDGNVLYKSNGTDPALLAIEFQKNKKK
jgi:hypothetical protein